jgi:Glycosyltransferase family 87
VTRWYLAFAAFAAALAVASGQPIERCWGTWAAIGYATAAAITAAAPRRRERQAAAVALGCAAGCATVAPLAWQAVADLPSRAGQGSLTVIAQAGGQLLRHGTPYLPAAGLTHVLAYDPYEPLMTVFGLPNAAGLTGWPANPRLWLALTGTAGVYLAFRIPGAPPRQALRSTALALASPVLALPLATGGSDLPVMASLCVALALAERAPRRAAALAAGLAVGLACALKAIAWPAGPVIAALAAGRGAHVSWRCTVTAAVTAVAAMAAAAPAALSDPGATVQNAILFPLGLTSHRSPAASPLPGRLLASAGPTGKWAVLALLAAAVAAFAWRLARRPPRTSRSAAVLLAAGITAAVTLAPAARWGYYAYPLALLGWLRLSRPGWPCSYSSERALATPPASAVASPGAASTGADAVPASG